MKKLVCVGDIEDMIRQGQKLLNADSGTIITPAARDAAAAGGIDIRRCDAAPAEDHAGGGGVDSEVIYRALRVLAAKGLLADEDSLPDVFRAREPYRAERDPSGLKIVRGDSVQTEFLDTGNPNNDVRYRELISGDDSRAMNAGFLEIDHCSFDWEVGCDEMYYVIRGPLSITVNGNTYTARSGDVVNLPVGRTVVFHAPEKAKMFYGIKAAEQ
jgi:ethanolamine utilization protein EutQ